MNLFWTTGRLARLEKLRKRDVSYQAIAEEIGATPAAARAAYKRHIVGRPDEADADAVAQRSRERSAAFAAWETANRDKRNAARREARKAKRKEA